MNLQYCTATLNTTDKNLTETVLQGCHSIY